MTSVADLAEKRAKNTFPAYPFRILTLSTIDAVIVAVVVKVISAASVE